MSKHIETKEVNAIFDDVIQRIEKKRLEENYTAVNDILDPNAEPNVDGLLFSFCHFLKQEVNENGTYKYLDSKTLKAIKNNIVGLVIATDKYRSSVVKADKDSALNDFVVHANSLKRMDCSPDAKTLNKFSCSVFGMFLGGMLLAGGFPIFAAVAGGLIIGASTYWAYREGLQHRRTSHAKKALISSAASFFPADSAAGKFQKKSTNKVAAVSTQDAGVGEATDAPLLTGPDS